MLKIRWIGQSGYILSDDKITICIDPYLSNVVDRIAGRGRMVNPPFAPGELKSDAVICTHNHLDHVDIDAIPLMKKDDMLFLAPTDAKKQLRDCGVVNYHEFNVGDTYTIGDFKLRAVYADHSVPAIGIILTHNKLNLYFSGDTLYNEELEKLKKYNIDIMFICINGKLGNMNADEAVKLTKIINPRVAVPTHYGMFESNTENPVNYTSKIDCGFIMEYNTLYEIEEVLNGV